MKLSLRVDQKRVVSRSLFFYLMLILLMSSPIRSVNGQASIGFPIGKSLSLTVWGAGVSEQNSEGRRWDTQSPPDTLVRVYLGSRLIGESGVRRDRLQPMWALTVGPIPERRFYEGAINVSIIDQDVWGEEVIEELLIPLPTARELNSVLKISGEQVKPLIYQWVDASAQFSLNPDSALRDREPSFKEVNPLGGRSSDDSAQEKGLSSRLPPELGEEERLKAEQGVRRSAKRASAAAKLYRAYLRAQFSGDQLREHSILLTLIQRYGQTRHGRKARRILLLDGR